MLNTQVGNIHNDEHSDHWLHVVGKGGNIREVMLPRLARTALDQHLM
jgi:site-specific recombinase XerC